MQVVAVKLYLFMICGLANSLQVIMERSALLGFNTKYVEWGKVYTMRYGRKSPYYLNVEGHIIHTWNNNMTINILFYEYLHNEYRRSFVEMHMKFCDAVNSDPYVGKMIAKAGVVCPLTPGPQHINNMTIEAAEFPNVWPFRKAKVMVELSLTDTPIVMASLEIYITFLQKKKN